MSQPWQKPLILANKLDVLRILEEIDAAGDLDLWQEAAAKLNDVIVVYRRSQRPAPAPAHFTFSDGVTRSIDRMAFDAAYAEAFPDWNGDDEFPAWMERGEGGPR